ncbi:MAG: hypothetical protein OXH06_18975 [Gemmatimonadetes bacterium]|nr:hypothetical protein [Gemmatimonadota bacterium]
MFIRHDDREFRLIARHDGDFWLVEVFEIVDGEQRLRYEYKLNTPRDEATARERAWELFATRNLETGKT